jgi:hypothetical protein
VLPQSGVTGNVPSMLFSHFVPQNGGCNRGPATQTKPPFRGTKQLSHLLAYTLIWRERRPTPARSRASRYILTPQPTLQIGSHSDQDPLDAIRLRPDPQAYYIMQDRTSRIWPSRRIDHLLYENGLLWVPKFALVAHKFPELAETRGVRFDVRDGPYPAATSALSQALTPSLPSIPRLFMSSDPTQYSREFHSVTPAHSSSLGPSSWVSTVQAAIPRLVWRRFLLPPCPRTVP